MEEWPSGLRRTPGKRVGVHAPRGFESPFLRQKFQKKEIFNMETSVKKGFLIILYISGYIRFCKKNLLEKLIEYER